MRRLFAMIAAIMKTMGSFTTEMVREGGRWVAKLVRVPGSAAPATPEPVDEVTQTETVPESFDGVRRLAGVIAMGKTPTADDMIGVTDKAARWVAVQPKEALHRIMCADDEQLREHMKNRSPICGVVPFDDAAIADMQMVDLGQAAEAEPAPVMRTRRQALREKGMTI